MTATTRPVITLDEQIAEWSKFVDDEIRYGIANTTSQAILASLLRLREIERELREPSAEMLSAGSATDGIRQVNEWITEMQLVRGRKPNWTAENPPLAQAWKAMSAILLREKP